MQQLPETVIDPVCGMKVDPASAFRVDHAGASYYFCEIACLETFRDEPERWLPGRDRDPFEHAH